MYQKKRCIVFVVDKLNEEQWWDSIEFYAFDDEFVPMEMEWLGELPCIRTEFAMKVLEDPTKIAQPFTRVEHCHRLSGFISRGNMLFRVGGDYENCGTCRSGGRVVEPKSYSLQTTEFWDAETSTWFPLPNLNFPRRSPHLHILNGKLYAAGGFVSFVTYGGEDDDPVPSFMEVLDEEKGSWISIPNPPLSEMDFNFFVSATLTTGILIGFHGSNCFFLYTPTDGGTWKCVDNIHLDSYLLSRCLSTASEPAMQLEGHLLWLSEYNLVALDLNSGLYFSICLVRFPELLPCSKVNRYQSPEMLPCTKVSRYQPQLVLLEDNVLALIWCDRLLYKALTNEQGEKQVPRMTDPGGYHCTKFSIDFERAHKSLSRGVSSDCIRVHSRYRCFGPTAVFHGLTAAFVADVSMAAALKSKEDEVQRGIEGEEESSQDSMASNVYKH